MKQLSIENASVGYSTVGIEEYISDLNIRVVDELISKIHKTIPQIRTKVDSVWVGQSADAFKNRLEDDSQIVIETLGTLKEYFESEMAQIGKNVDNYDEAIAEAIMNGDFSGVEISSNAKASVSTLGSFSNYYSQKQSESDTVSNWWNDVSSYAGGLLSKIDEVYDRVGATVGVAGLGLLEGLGEFGEALVDFSAIFNSIINTPMTLLVDGVKGAYSLVTGAEFSSSTKGMWDRTKAFVEKDYVNGWFDNFYDNTEAGNYLKNKAYGYEMTRGISSGLGYTAGVVALSIATLGGGTLAVGGAGVGTTQAFNTTMSLVGGMAGMGRGTEKAWADGATTIEGLMAGTTTGIWEGAQFYIGGKINGFNPFDSALKNIGTRIGLDSLVGGFETPVQAIIDTMYKDGYYDDNGNYIPFGANDSIIKRFTEMFNDEGGFGGVTMNASVGAIGSTLGELGNIKKAFSLDVPPPSVNARVANKTTVSIDGHNFNTTASVKELSKLSLTEQLSTIENANLSSLKNLELDGLDSSVIKAIDDKVFMHQNVLAEQCLDGWGASESKTLLDRLLANPEKMSDISDTNLAKLLSGVSDNTQKQLLIDEASRRIDAGNIVFDKGYFDYNDFFSGKTDGIIGAISALPDATQTKLVSLVDAKIENLPNTITDLNINKLQKLNLADLIESGRVDSKGISIIQNLSNQSPNSLKTFNFNTLDKEIIKDFGEDFAVSAGSFTGVGTKLVSLKDNNPDLYSVFKSVQDTLSADTSLGNQANISQKSLDFIFDNSVGLKNMNIENVNPHDLLEYALLKDAAEKSYGTNTFANIDFSSNFREEYAQAIDKNFSKNYDDYLRFQKYNIGTDSYLNNMKDDYFQKYFSMTRQEAESFIHKYGDNLNTISQNLSDADGQRLSSVVDYLKQINETKDASKLTDIYNAQNFKISREELIALDEIGRKKYGEVYAQTFAQTKETINSLIPTSEKITIDGKQINIVDAPNGISALVHSSDTGFKGDKALINGNYVDTWNDIGVNRTHGLSTTFITSENMGSAPVQNTGVLYGFYDIGSKDIQSMAPYDVNSRIADYGFNTGNQQIYMSPDAMSANTNRVYNEFVLSRPDSNPSCVIVYKDMEDKLVQNAYKAAADWDIPVVRIDKVAAAKTQAENITGFLDIFNSTKDTNALKASVELFESNTSGFGLNIKSAGGVDSLADMTNKSVSGIFNPSEIETQVSSYADYLSKMPENNKQVDEAIRIFEDVKSSYKLSAENSTSALNKTESLLDLDGMINKLESVRSKWIN